jgi:crotonobetainyl-CoA:carnitine CoA-transferase CaiB-like acyl-CoA transferase
LILRGSFALFKAVDILLFFPRANGQDVWPLCTSLDGTRLKVGLQGLLEEIGLSTSDGLVNVTGSDPVVSSPHRLGGATAIALAAQGAGVATIRRMRCNDAESVTVDIANAIHGLNCLEYLKQCSYPIRISFNITEPGTGFFRTKDGRVLNSTTLRTDTRIRIFEFLNCGCSNDAFQEAVGKWTASELEAASVERGLPLTIVRTPEEWRRHPHGKLLAARPVIDIEKIADGEPVPFAKSSGRTLAGLRVLDAAHILAGPTVGRTLAEQGADVLRISAPRQTDLLNMVMETGIGKRSAYLDLDTRVGVERFLALADEADVFVQSYSPGSLARRGISVERLARSRKGIVCVTISCYGAADGPFGNWIGYDSNSQAATGIAATEGSLGSPLSPPTRLLADYLTGYLGAAGALAALVRRAREGGSYHVQLSLCRTAMWVQDLGLVDPKMSASVPVPPQTATMQSPFGELEYLAPLTRFSVSPSFWDKPPEPLGSSRAEWIAA